MTKTHTLAEILTDHMDAVKEGRVKNSGYTMKFVYQQVSMVHDCSGGTSRALLIDGYAIDATEPERPS